MSLTSRLQALLTYANDTTGQADTTLGDAVRTLAAGYGGGGSAVAEGEITLDTASETITVTHNLGTQNVAILVEHENPTYGVNGAVGCLFVNKTGIPFSASGFFADGAIHVVYETRTAWASYSTAQVNSTSSQAYFSTTDNAVTIPCRISNYKYQTGTYKYKVLAL